MGTVGTRPGQTWKTPKNLSEHESEECGREESGIGERRRYSGSYRTSPRQLFIIRVKREVKRPYRNGCRYNERLNTETGGSKTRYISLADESVRGWGLRFR